MTRASSHRGIALALMLLAGACDDAPTAPSSTMGLTLEVSLSGFNSNLGVFPKLIYRLRNTSDTIVSLYMPGCTIRPSVETWYGSVVHRVEVGPVCGGSGRTITLAPGASYAYDNSVALGPTYSVVANTITLPRGRYRAFAEVDARLDFPTGPRVELRSRGTWFRL
jgi:hypothetical protein